MRSPDSSERSDLPWHCPGYGRPEKQVWNGTQLGKQSNDYDSLGSPTEKKNPKNKIRHEKFVLAEFTIVEVEDQQREKASGNPVGIRNNADSKECSREKFRRKIEPEKWSDNRYSTRATLRRITGHFPHN